MSTRKTPVKSAKTVSHTHTHPDSFDTMIATLQAHFGAVVEGNGSHLFFVETAADLYETYLRNLADRQYHTCHCCRQFINRFGSLASVNADGTLTPAIWGNVEDVPEMYRASVSALAKAVAGGKIASIAFINGDVWGTPQTGDWTHFAVKAPAGVPYRGMGRFTNEQAMSVKREDHRTLMAGVQEFDIKTVKQAVTLIEAEALYRGEKVLGSARFLLNLHNARKDVRGRRRDNLTWRAVAGAPVGFCQPRSTMVGTLLEDIAAGLNFDQVKARFAAKMAPHLHQRPQAPPKAGNIAQAEKLVAQMGLAPSLKRRAARLDEIETIWTPKRVEKPAAPAGRVFAHLLPKGERPAEPMAMRAQVITWEKFARTVLSSAIKIEARMVHGSNSICGITTAVNFDAPPILQWDSESRRNPFSEYFYRNGSTPEQWGLASGSWVNVTAVTLLPSMWHNPERFEHQGKGAIFVLEGAQDQRAGGSGLFPEILKSSLHEVRATIEAHSNSQELEGRDDGSANGVCASVKGCANEFRVTTPTGVVVYKIDRWD